MSKFINEPFQHLSERLLAFLPHLLMAAVILLLGFVAGWLAKAIFRRILVLLKLDTYSERGGLSSLLVKGGLREPPSVLLAKVAGGVVVFAFFLIALSALNLKVLDHIIEQVFSYLPNVFIAVIIAVLGYMLGNFLGRAALIASVNAGVQLSRFVSRFVRILVFSLTTLIALEQLGVGKETVQLAFAIFFSGIVLALAIAFGLGGRDLAREYLEKKLRETPSEDDIRHL
jgi:hypothetical protein